MSGKLRLNEIETKQQQQQIIDIAHPFAHESLIEK